MEWRACASGGSGIGMEPVELRGISLERLDKVFEAMGPISQAGSRHDRCHGHGPENPFAVILPGAPNMRSINPLKPPSSKLQQHRLRFMTSMYL